MATDSTNSNPIQPGQDRRIDQSTASWFCTGCPFLGIDNSRVTKQIIVSGNSVTYPEDQINGPANTVPFEDASMEHASYTKTSYVCTSPQ